jgi:peptidyl-tRNA hydrolase
VLEPLTEGEREEFKKMIEENLEALEVLIPEGRQAAMNRFHKDREE